MKNTLLFLLVVCLPATALAQTGAPSAGSADTAARGDDFVRKEARALRVDAGALEIDGRLEEAVWQSAPVIADFVQKQPVEGAPPTERTEVRILYDDEALYVGARMYADDPGAIQAPVTRRDNVAQSEHFLISLDTYLDRRTAYTLGVTASGVRLDWYHASDDERNQDAGWDPVWEADARIDSIGWTAELRIPFSQLRFSPRAQQVWGMNLDRWIPSRNEDVFWMPVPTDVQAWASRFGNLVGIEGIAPSRRIEVLPYVAAAATLHDEVDPADPFADEREGTARMGADLKMGLGPNLTLEATINPDFGQVEADPAEVNLSAYETFFPERRPFFLEGAQLFESFGPAYFYSRRIGARPPGAAPGDFADAPEQSTILGAAKLTGRLPSGTSIGVLGAVTDEESADFFVADAGEFGEVVVAPYTAFGVSRVEQEFGRYTSTAGLTLTAVHRSLDASSPLAAQLARDAVAGGGNWNLRFGGGHNYFSGQLGFSHVAGEAASIARLQRSSARYFQRPDAEHVEFDPARTSLTGWTAAAALGRTGGGHWVWDARVIAESPGFELNDAGILGRADNVFGLLSAGYQETQPGDVLRNWRVRLSSENLWNFDGDRNFAALRTDATLTWLNFWRTDLTAWVDFRSQSDDLTRGGPLMGVPQAWVVIARLGSAFGASTRWNGRIYWGENELGGLTYRLSGGLSVRPGPNWQLSIDPNYLRSEDPLQYVRTLDGGTPATFGKRYVFGHIDRSTFLVQMRANYTFKPDLTLELYAEPFAASGRFDSFGELPAAGARGLRVYGEAPGTAIEEVEDGVYRVTDGDDVFSFRRGDFNVLSLRTNLVLRWEWRPGSTLYAVWQEDRSGFEPFGDLVGPSRLLDSFSASGDHRFAVKMSYWFGG